MAEVAVGVLGLSIDEFEAYTPRELQWRHDAVVAKERRDLERLAQLASWVMSPWLKDVVTADELMGKPKKTDWQAWATAR